MTRRRPESHKASAGALQARVDSLAGRIITMWNSPDQLSMAAIANEFNIPTVAYIVPILEAAGITHEMREARRQYRRSASAGKKYSIPSQNEWKRQRGSRESPPGTFEDVPKFVLRVERTRPSPKGVTLP